LELSYKQEIILPPPQFYELSRLITFGSIEHLANFAVQKNSTGSELWMPVRQQALDGEVTLLPGIRINLLKSSEEERIMESHINCLLFIPCIINN
jgi:hypothetical protein